jgi:excisionase family DNA binding protein
MRTNQSLTMTVEQAAEVLGIGRATAYALVGTGDIASVRLGRRIVVPVAHLAERLGVDRADVWAALEPLASPEPVRTASAAASRRPANGQRRPVGSEMPPLF